MTIKRNILIILFVLINTYLLGQTIFTETYHTDKSTVAGKVSTDNSGNYIMHGSYKSQSGLSLPFAYKVNRSGELIDSVKYFQNSVDHIVLSQFIPMNDYYIFILSIRESAIYNPPKKTFVYMKTDTNFNIIDTQFYYLLNNATIFSTNSTIDKDSNIIMTGWYIVPTGYNGSFITKTSKDGDSLAFHIIPPDSIRSFTALHVDSNFYYAFSCGLWDQKIYKYDYNLNLIEKLPINNSAYEKFTPIFINDSIYYTSGWRQSNQYKEYGVMKTSLKGTLYRNIEFGIVDSINTLANTEALCKSGNYFYLFGNPYTPSNQSTYGNGDPSWNYVAKLDTNLNIIWEKLYGGDAFYMAADITTDTDGGILLLSRRNDLNDIGNKLEVHLMKIDTAGNAVWINNINIADIVIDIYPNPTSSILNIALQSSHNTISQIKIIDIQGKQILKKQIDSKQAKLNVSNLTKGVYLIEGTTNTGESFKRKFIKN